MSHTLHRTTVRLMLAAAVLSGSVLVPGAAALATGPAPTVKAQVEYAERQAMAADHPTKAQVEYAERSRPAAAAGAAGPSVTAATTSSTPSTGRDAAPWELAVSAAFGAALAGGVIVTSRRVLDHRRVLVS